LYYIVIHLKGIKSLSFFIF